jgi:hypothetical protein
VACGAADALHQVGDRQLAAAQGQGRRARLGLRDSGVAEESEDSKADERFLRDVEESELDMRERETLTPSFE